MTDNFEVEETDAEIIKRLRRSREGWKADCEREMQNKLDREAELKTVRKQIAYIKAEFDECWDKERLSVDLRDAISAAIPEPKK